LLGGFDTSIYQFKLRGAPKDLDRPLVLRLYPERYGPESAVWESRVQNALAAEGYPAARAHLLCTDKSILGGVFFLMDLLPGALLVTAPPGSMFEILGQAHARLHRNDPQPLIAALTRQGVEQDRYRLDHRRELRQRMADALPWTREGIDWLDAHRPSEPAHVAICHGDFHPLNILIRGTTVTGILDWADFSIADPAWDVANTLLRITMPYKYLVSPILGASYSSVDWDEGAQVYLDAYRAQNPLGAANLAYYRARQSIQSLIEGVQGHPVWRYPPIAQELMQSIHQLTGIRVKMPD
jgi:aminoglycoside phosphotransferase (APT) family kinase protein